MFLMVDILCISLIEGRPEMPKPVVKTKVTNPMETIAAEPYMDMGGNHGKQSVNDGAKG